MSEIIPIQKQPQPTPEAQPTPESTIPADLIGIDSYTRSLIPPSAAMVGRSVKQRNLFSTSGAVACDAEIVTFNADGSADPGSTLKSFTFFANELHVGMCIRIHASGLVSDSGTGPVCSWTFLTDSVTLASAQTTAFAASSSDPWNMTLYCVVKSIGPSGELTPALEATIDNTSKDNNASAAQTIDTTAALTIYLNAGWNSAAAGNSVTIRQWLVEILY